METIRFALCGGLSASHREAIHQAVLSVLADTGMACSHAPTVDAVMAEKGIRYQGGRLRFSRELVNETIDRVRAVGRKRTPVQRIRVTAPWNCFNVIDMDTNAVRPSTAADVAPMLKLVASFNRDGHPPVYPGNLDNRIQILWLEKACLELTDGFGGGVVSHDPETIRWIAELYAAVGHRYPLALQAVISPLRFDHLALDTLWQFKDDPKVAPSINTCPIPVGGQTAPLSAPGLLAQSVAECLGAVIVADRVDFGASKPRAWIGVDFGDLQYMTVGHSLPENLMLWVLLRDVSEHFLGFPMDAVTLCTNAKRADTFAAVDRMGYMLMLGLAGFRLFWLGAGMLSMDEVFSPAQFIIDMEIGRYVQRILDGLHWSEGDPESIAASIAEGVAAGDFLTHRETLRDLREFFYSELFPRSNVGQWRAAGESTTEELALTRAREAIASYQFQRDTRVQAELDRIFGDACRDLGVDPASQPIPVGETC